MNNSSLAFLCHPYHRGGVTRWMIDAAIAASDLGVDTYFITVNPTVEFSNAKGKEKIISLFPPNHKVKMIFKDVGRNFELGTNNFRSLTYFNLIKKSIPPGTPIIVSDDSAVWESTAWLSKKHPFIAVLHSDEESYYLKAEQYQEYISSYVCVSNRIKQNLQKQLPNIEISIIPCGINFDLPHFKIYETSTDSRFNHGYVTKLVWAGRIEEQQKRVSDLLKISLKLKEIKHPFELLIIGTGPKEIEIKNSIHDLGLSDHVKLLGWKTKDQLFEIYNNSDIYISTSNYEGMPVSVMEAMISGCSLVSSKVSGVEDLVSPESERFVKIFEIGDAEAAVKEIIKLGSDINISRKLPQDFAMNNFSIELCLKRYLNLTKNINPAQKNKNQPSFFLVKIFADIISTARIVRKYFSNLTRN